MSSLKKPMEKTGFVRVEEIEGIWWFVGPTGEPFLSLGVNHIEPHLWMGSYNREHTLERYGPDFVLFNGRFNPDGKAAQRWIDRQVEVCRTLGFNTFAKHTHPSIPTQLYSDQIYYVASLETAPLSNWRQARGEVSMPDIFSADFERHLSKRVQEVCGEHRESRNLLGYLFVDTPTWETAHTPGSNEEDVMIYPWVNSILHLGEHAPGKCAWIEHLKSRYSKADEAAHTWGIPVSPAYGISWNYLARLETWFLPANPERAKADLVPFMGLIAERWYRLHHDAIRKEDPNHLILGDKSRVDMFREWLLPALAKYVDVVLIQSYNPFDQDREVMDWIHESTGKPILNGDGSFGYPNPHQQKYSVKGFPSNARSAEEVGSMYRQYLEETVARLYMLGWHHCGYLEQWDDSERGDVNSNENGFLDPFENEHQSWTDVIREANRRAHAQHEGTAKHRRSITRGSESDFD